MGEMYGNGVGTGKYDGVEITTIYFTMSLLYNNQSCSSVSEKPTLQTITHTEECTALKASLNWLFHPTEM